jgi:hypothetical protein
MTTTPLARKVRRIGHLDLPGGGQVVVEAKHAYVGHMKPPHGTSILDVADPARPRVVAQIGLEGDDSHTHKVRVVGDLMFVNVEQNERHFRRKGDRLPHLRADLQAKLGRPPSDAELAAELKVGKNDIPALDAARERGYRDGGFRIYDIADKARPRLIHHQKTYGFGVHARVILGVQTGRGAPNGNPRTGAVRLGPGTTSCNSRSIAEFGSPVRARAD